MQNGTPATNRPGRLSGRVAMITGAGSGIGAACARRFAAEGASLLLSDLDGDAAERICAGLDGAIPLRQDVTSEADWEAAAAAVRDRFGRIDILVNNAGRGGFTPLLSASLDQWRAILATNLDSAFLGMRAICPIMAESGGGSVVNMASMLGRVGQPGYGAYCASKGGVLMLTKAAAIELAGSNIRVNAVLPGFIDTPMNDAVFAKMRDPDALRKAMLGDQPMPRMGTADEIADAALFLASDESSFMTGAELVIDGGYTAR